MSDTGFSLKNPFNLAGTFRRQRQRIKELERERDQWKHAANRWHEAWYKKVTLLARVRDELRSIYEGPPDNQAKDAQHEGDD